ncbi:MAG: hypothetical protein WDN00_15285 [Limisphaerales bacterium]
MVRVLTTTYTRIGGLMRDIPPTWCDQVRQFLKEFAVALDEAHTLLTRNRIWVDRLRDLGVISKEMAIDYGLSGPNLRGSGIEWDFTQKPALSLLQGFGFRYCRWLRW